MTKLLNIIASNIISFYRLQQNKKKEIEIKSSLNRIIVDDLIRVFFLIKYSYNLATTPNTHTHTYVSIADCAQKKKEIIKNWKERKMENCAIHPIHRFILIKQQYTIREHVYDKHKSTSRLKPMPMLIIYTFTLCNRNNTVG